MKILAIEQSTPTGSLALIEDSETLIEESWRNTRDQTKSLFHLVPEICAETGIKLSEISLFAVGLGPGGYTGLRISITAAVAYALPGRTCCYGISSGHVLAYQVFKHDSTPEITIIGDARRGHIWTGSFKPANRLPEQISAWQVIPVEKLNDSIKPESTVITSEPERLSNQLAALKAAGLNIVEKPLVPKASELGSLAQLMFRAGIPSQPLKPVYAHPAVEDKKEPLE